MLVPKSIQLRGFRKELCLEIGDGKSNYFLITISDKECKIVFDIEFGSENAWINESYE